MIRSIGLVFPPSTNGIAAFFPLLLKSNCSPKHLKSLFPGVAYMSLPAGKAIHLVAFILPCLVYANSQTYLLFICLLFIYVNNICVYLLFSNFILYLCFVFKKQCLIKILNVMEKYYLCSIQSKKNPGQNETVLVPINEVPLFIFSTLNSDCLLIFSDCSTFNSKSNNEK